MAYSYSKLNSENARLLRALIDEETPYTEDTGSRNATILKSIINETEYTEEPQSEIEELLLELKQKIDGGIVAEPLLATENGIYTAEEGKAFTPVTVNVPLPENAVLLKSLTGLPQDVATFNDGADAPLNELKISIEAVQSGSGEPSPTNVRPIAGWSGANIVKYSTLKNLFNINTLKDSTGLDQYTGAEISQASVKSSAWIKAKPNTSYFWNGSADLRALLLVARQQVKRRVHHSELLRVASDPVHTCNGGKTLWGGLRQTSRDQHTGIRVAADQTAHRLTDLAVGLLGDGAGIQELLKTVIAHYLILGGEDELRIKIEFS